MYEIKETSERVDGSMVEVFSREIYNCNVLGVSAGTTGYCGGDSGHGCRTIIRISDLGGTDLRARVIPRRYPAPDNAAEEVEIVLGGDAELQTIIEGLKFILRALEDGKESE
jgi:hypothetical protein